MLLRQFPNGDTLCREGHALFLAFAGQRRVLSTCELNGGVRDDLTGAFNFDQSLGKTTLCQMKAPTIGEHMHLIACELGVDPEYTTGMCTAAQMDHMAMETRVSGGVAVTAVVTGGIDDNGGRAGDPASWEERDGTIYNLTSGTINLFLHIDGDLSPGTLARALVTSTEAKTAAIQELLLPSCYSSGLATGSGTDHAVLVANPAGVRLTNAGKHSKLGELIGDATLCAVKRALFLQNGAGPERMRDALRRMGRFGMTAEGLFARAQTWCAWDEERRPRFYAALEQVGRSGDWPVLSSLYAHVLDQLGWGLIAPEEAARAACKLLTLLEEEPRLTAEGLIGDFADALARAAVKQMRKEVEE